MAYVPNKMRPTLPLDEWKVIYPLWRVWFDIWNKWDRDHMLNEGDEEVWCSWDENGNSL